MELFIAIYILAKMANNKNLKKNITDFEKNGFTIFRSLLKKNEIQKAKKEVQKISKIIKSKSAIEIAIIAFVLKL